MIEIIVHASVNKTHTVQGFLNYVDRNFSSLNWNSVEHKQQKTHLGAPQKHHPFSLTQSSSFAQTDRIETLQI